MVAERVRVLAYFPVGSTERAELRGWADASEESLRGYGPWRAPADKEDLGLQDYGAGILDRFLRRMPRGVVELRGVPDVVGDRVDRFLSGETARWRLVDARLSLWNVGTGLVLFTFDLPATAYRDASSLVLDTRGLVAAMAPEVTALVRARLGRAAASAWKRRT
ncbi:MULTISPECIES: hypothetical protein [Catenuloplanes]|uniref:Uncharacterized protein n=1 Tax=Catenuloplanes niger TaxID=587534 RepID=A0AAE3ZY37_9ACTN|nr:hypothetical protein [Catenuloplanes niger]MDR7326946.1 hypothetical protein [Catenuloplanes niger]